MAVGACLLPDLMMQVVVLVVLLQVYYLVQNCYNSVAFISTWAWWWRANCLMRPITGLWSALASQSGGQSGDLYQRFSLAADSFWLFRCCPENSSCITFTLNQQNSQLTSFLSILFWTCLLEASRGLIITGVYQTFQNHNWLMCFRLHTL